MVLHTINLTFRASSTLNSAANVQSNPVMQRPCQPAAERYAAKLAGLYPEDPWHAALADQAYFQLDDAYQVRSARCQSPMQRALLLSVHVLRIKWHIVYAHQDGHSQ